MHAGLYLQIKKEKRSLRILRCRWKDNIKTDFEG
jgi:hypothetical protein